MDVTDFKRDASKVHAVLRELEDGTVVCSKPVRIYVPARFAEQQLAILGTRTYVSGIYMISDEQGNYGVSTANAMMEIHPTSTQTVKFGEDEYLEFSFDAGSVVIVNVNLVKTKTFIYTIYSEIIAKGYVPWFMSYEDLGRIFESGPKHAGVRVGANAAVVEMIVASISRKPNDRMVYYRHTVDRKDPVGNPVAFIPLRSVTYGASNTTAKMMGQFFDEGINSALVNPAEKVEPIEELLRR